MQTVRIARYLPLFPAQAADAITADSNACVRVLTANVLMDNRDIDRLLSLVRDADPDIALFVEVDDWWDERLGALETSHPHTVRHPLGNYYGMSLFSRLPLSDARVRFLIRDDIPSIKTTVTLPSGDEFVLYGLHPVPPPLADTETRDAEILVAAREIAAQDPPAIIAGDLNDVSWSRTTRMFMRISGLLDPRVGRGIFASYHAKYPLMRWPLDHIFHDPAFRVAGLRLLEGFGSDHFPVLVDLCHQPGKPAPDAPETADAADRAEAARKIDAGKKADAANNDPSTV